MQSDPGVASALARWAVIAPATDERLTPAEPGLLLDELAAGVHRGPDGRVVRVTRRTLYRWLAAWRAAGFDGLQPAHRRDAGAPRTDPELLELAAALRREAPARSAAQIAEILRRTRGLVVSERTLQRSSPPAAWSGPGWRAATAPTGGLRPPLPVTCGSPTLGTAQPSPSWAAAMRSCSWSWTTTPGWSATAPSTPTSASAASSTAWAPRSAAVGCRGCCMSTTGRRSSPPSSS